MAKNNPYRTFDPFYYIEMMITDEKYLEALVVISSHVEIFLEEIVVAASYLQARKNGFSIKKIQEAVSTNSFDMNIKTAVCLGLIDKQLYDDLKSFKTERNNMIHDVFRLREKTAAHLKSVIKMGREIYIEMLEIRGPLVQDGLVKGTT